MWFPLIVQRNKAQNSRLITTTLQEWCVPPIGQPPVLQTDTIEVVWITFQPMWAPIMEALCIDNVELTKLESAHLFKCCTQEQF